MNQVESVEHMPDMLFQPQRRRWRLWVGIPLILFIVWLAAAYGFFAYWSDRQVREAMAEADRDSPSGWQLKDIEANRERVPDKDNAALVVLKFKSFLPGDWPMITIPQPAATESAEEGGAGGSDPAQDWYERLADLSPEIQLDETLLRGLRADLEKVGRARAEARQLIGMTRGRFPLEWTDDVFMTKLNSQATRTAATFLRHEAALAAQNGDADGAVAFVRGVLTAARSVGDEPTLISALFRFACAAQGVAALERSLAQGEPSARELKTVQALLEKEATEPVFVHATRGERAGMHQMLLSLRHGQTNLSQFMAPTKGLDKQLLEFTGPTLARRSHGYLLQLMNEYVQASKLAPEQQRPAMKGLEQKVLQSRRQYDVVTALLMPAIMKVEDANRRNAGNLRCAFVAVALERYRYDHGHWPLTLDALVPEYLAAVSTDPQDGQPLRYKRTPNGVVVYWVGPDGTDDGGRLDRHSPLTKGTDQGFQLWDVKDRRQPFREQLPPPTEDEVP